MVSVLTDAWHQIKGRDVGGSNVHARTGGLRPENGHHAYDIHDGLEDGTLPFHSILALGEAIDVHARLYGSMDNVSRHTTNLSTHLYGVLKSLRHPNGRPLCHIYCEDGGAGYGDPRKQGATVAFNLVDSSGNYIPYSDVEGIANDERIYIRSGGQYTPSHGLPNICQLTQQPGICCPGGIYTALEYEPWHLQRALSAHHTCVRTFPCSPLTAIDIRQLAS